MLRRLAVTLVAVMLVLPPASFGSPAFEDGAGVAARFAARRTEPGAGVFSATPALSEAAPTTAQGSGPTKLLRFPDIHGDRVAFTYAGDLWTAPAEGGTAVRLTAHPGVELMARFSPDGEWIAFTGQYDGDEQVYVVPAGGGVPRQLTYYPASGPLPPRWGYDNLVYGWTPDGGRVLFRSLRDGRGISDGRLYTVSRDGGLAEALPMPQAGAGEFLPGGRIVYSPLFRDFRTWKRYQGGWAQDLWIFDLDTYEATNFTDDPRTDRDPMWVGDRVYFASDRDGTLNIFSYDPQSAATEQITRSRVWDVRWPAADGESRIVYELGGELHVLDTGTGESRPIAIFVPDDGLAMRPSHLDVADDIEDFEVSWKGERALFVARGDVFTAPIESGPTRNLTRSSGAHDKGARWSPDGRKVAYISDADGEEEIWWVDQDGTGRPEQLTDGHAGMLFPPAWSPDGERLAFTDQAGRLYVLEVESRREQVVADEPNGLMQSFAWSPRGGHIAYVLTEDTGFGSIWIWSVDDGRARRVTGPLFNEFSPAWSPDGTYLFYLGDRQFAPQLGSFEWNYVVDRETYVYALALRQDVAHPFPPESDEVTVEDEEDEEEEEDGETGEGVAGSGEGGQEGSGEQSQAQTGAGEPEAEAGGSDEPEGYLRIDFDGLAERVARVPIEADNLGGLSANDGHLIYFRGGAGYYGRSSDAPPSLMIFSMEDREATTLAENVGAYAVSGDGSKLLVQQRGSYYLYPAAPNGEDRRQQVSTAGLGVDRVPEQEWRQIFGEVWRRFRDFFYVPNMHGYDWEDLRRRYEPLLEHVAHRSDLNYVIGEMISELNVSHAYISGGDFEVPPRPRVALPGARFELDADVGRYRLARLFAGHNEEDKYRAPLTEIGVDVSEGDYVLAVDGEELAGDDNPYRLLRHKGDQPVVRLTVNDRPSLEGARQVEFRPLGSETDLIYLDWVEANHAYVSEQTGGRVGYLHIPDMGASGIYEFIKWYYGQIRKEGLVVDVRANGGGNVSAMLINRLSRELLATGFARHIEATSTYPQNVFYGHMAAILNETSGSDGDIFPAMFRRAGLGPLIGKRSWGGVVGITSYGPLIDGGQVNVPQFGFASVDGEWILENQGVVPDIVVDNDPAAVIAGRDPQLDRAIEEVMQRIREAPKRLPGRPAPPVKIVSESRRRP